MEAKYVNPFTDFGFTKIFGEEASKFLLLDFLNALLSGPTPIRNLSFKNTEQFGQIVEERKAIFDIYCENERGEKFIVEMQKAEQDYFKERTIYYSTFPIREQAKKGTWNFDLKAVFCVGILDFTFSDYGSEQGGGDVVHEIKLKNQDGKTFYDKLTYMYLEMPNFIKTEMELESRLDKWLYFIKHLEDFRSIPDIFTDEVVFVEAFEKAELSKFNQAELDEYEYSLKIYRDLINVVDSAGNAGEKRGVRIGILKVAKAMKQNGISTEIISKTTGLTETEIESL